MSTSTMPIAVILPAATVFPGTHSTIEELKCQLTRLSRTDSLIACARLNLIVSNATSRDRLQNQRSAVEAIFSTEEARRIEDFFAEQDEPEQTAVFFRAQLLELMQWVAIHCSDLPGDGRTFEDPNICQAFGKAALIAGELWSNRIYRATAALDGRTEETRKKHLAAMRIALDEASIGMDPMNAIARGRQMFLTHFRPSISQEFCEASGLSLEMFYALTAIVAVYYLARTPECGGPPQTPSVLFHEKHFAGLNSELGCAFQSYAAFASQTPDDLAASLRNAIGENQSIGNSRVLKCLRNRPILRRKDGLCIVMDPVFFAGHAAVGPLFAILGRKETANQCFGDFGYAFELYGHSVLRRMYPPQPAPLADRLECSVAGISQGGTDVQISDACLNNELDLVLFEMKAVWLPDECAEADDPSSYLTVLRDLYARPDEPRVSPKGAGQLAKSIAQLANGEWKPKVQDFTSVRTIYPVLLCYDSRLQAPLHPWYLAQEFRKALAPDEEYVDGDMRKGGFRVSGLIVLTIDDLETLERSVDNFGLIDLLRSYSQASADRMRDMRTFLSTSEYGKKLLASPTLGDGALAAIRDAEHLMKIPREA